MKALIFALAATIVLAPIAVRADAESHVWVYNTTGKYVWVSAFTTACNNGAGFVAGASGGGGCRDRHILHEWCVPPGGGPQNVIKQGFHYKLTTVDVLVTAHPNCSRPILKEWTLRFPHNSGSQSIKQQYNVTRQAKDSVTSYYIQAVP